MILVLVVRGKSIRIVMVNNLEKYIDHTALGFNTSIQVVKNICLEAMEYNFKAVCVPPIYVEVCKTFLDDTPVKVATVIGFPMGYSSTRVKCLEAQEALIAGADELDMVINNCYVANEDWDAVLQDILSVQSICHDYNAVLKVIIESGNIELNKIERLSEICNNLKVDFVKTSTGIIGQGATIEAVKAIRKIVSSQVEIKASGGIRTKEQVESFINAGATRIGSSASVKIVKE